MSRNNNPGDTPQHPRRMRLDELLVERGLAPTRSQARALAMSGRVRHGTERLDKPGRELPASIELTVDSPPRYVSRGGEKLEAWINAFPIGLAGRHVLDIGASTGGFTDCVLQAGAADVTCVDVGHGQLHAKLRQDPRVTSLEKVNARNLRPGDLPRASYDVIVADVSFISLRTILPAVWPFLAAGGTLIALVKPQFEAGREEASRGRGVIRDEALRQQILEGITQFSVGTLPGASLIGSIPSPIEGADGNREFLLGLSRQSRSCVAGKHSHLSGVSAPGSGGVAG